LKVLVCDNLEKVGVEILKNTKGLEVIEKQKIKADELKELAKDADAIIIRSASKIDASVLEVAGKLKVVGRAGIGLDNVDIPAASKKGVVVMNTPGGNTITTGEHAMALMMSLARKVPQATASMKAGKWEKNKFMGMELLDKVLGIVGLGNIGTVVAERALGFRMKVIGYDPFISKEKARDLGVEMVTLDELFSRSDIITFHTPITPETKKIVNAGNIAKMKDGVMIINCARGGLIDEQALHDAIVSGKVAGAALDVFSTEPPGDIPLLKLEQVITTPHLGASTEEAQIKVAIAMAEQIVDYLVNGTIRNAVNAPSLSREMYAKLEPYIRLAERLAAFKSQVSPGPIEEVTIEYSGDVADVDLKPLTIAALKGLLAPVLEGVNYVNAPIIAKERGIKVTETKSAQPKDFTNLITIKTRAGGVEGVVSGSVFGKKDARIVKVDDYELEAVLDGYILVLQNWDKPGTIGGIGTYLGKENVNIAGMQLGREKLGGKAIALLHVDQKVSDKVLAEFTKVPNIISAKLVDLNG
jgi:D-3-phosphoglycerate dehydrogenase